MNEACGAKIRELGEEVVGLRKRLQCMERERLDQTELSGAKRYRGSESAIGTGAREVDELRMRLREYEQLMHEANDVHRELQCDVDALRGECASLRDRVTRMMSGVVEGRGKDAAYSRLVACMTADELECVVPGCVKDAGGTGGGVGAIVAAIGCGSEEGVVWGAKRYGVDVGGVKVKGRFGYDVHLVEYATQRAYCRSVVVGVLCELDARGAGGVVGTAGYTPLHDAASRGRVGMCGMLVGAGVDVNAKDSYGSTALHDAASEGHAGVCEVLVGLGADVGVVDRVGDTAAAVALRGGHAALSARLGTMVAWGRGGDGVDEVRLDEIAREVVGDGVSGRGVALVGVGIEGGSAALVRRGVGAGGVDLNGKMWDGKMSITYAIECGDSDEVVTALIELGADARWEGGRHLRDAAERGRARVCGALIGGGVDVHGVDVNGNTALHWAAMIGHLEVCVVLVAGGANVGAVDKDNKTAAAVARERGHNGVAAYLDEQQ